jgi:hypothetical protein
LLLGLAGDPRDVELLDRLRATVPEALRALGWLGGITAIPVLIAALADPPLGGGGHDAARMAASALHRITGEGALPHGALDRDPGRWSARWAERRSALRADVRYRFGRPHAPNVVLDELWNEGSSAGDRGLAAIELGWHMGGVGGFEPTDWVARQRAALDRLAAFLVHSSAAPAPA